MWPKQILVTDQPIDVSDLTSAQWDYFSNLATHLADEYLRRGAGRQVFGLSGPPGSGKSVLAALLGYIFREESRFRYIYIGLDAFHYSNRALEELNLLSVKGRYDTYDTELLTHKLKRFKTGNSINFPTYSRQTHNPVPNVIRVSETNILLLLEGQWLLRNDPMWATIREFCSHQLFVEGQIDIMRNSVIKRHIAGGRTEEEAARFFASSDALNTREVLVNRVDADQTVPYYQDIR